MNSRHLTGLLATFVLVISSGCGGDDSSSGTMGSGGAGTGSGGSGPGGGGGEGGNDTGPELTAKMTVAHLSPDAPAVDFCGSFDGGGFIGPVFRNTSLAENISYGEVISPGNHLFSIPTGLAKFRVVPAGSITCLNSFEGSLDTEFEVTPNQSYTITIIGQATPPDDDKAIQMRDFYDGDTTSLMDKVKLRFIHASPDTANLDFGTDAGATFSPAFVDVAYGKEGMSSGGQYIEMAPLVDATLSARLHGSDSDMLVAQQVNLPGGAVVTVFAIGNSAGDPKPFQFLVCDDAAPKRNYTFTECSRLP